MVIEAREAFGSSIFSEIYHCLLGHLADQK